MKKGKSLTRCQEQLLQHAQCKSGRELLCCELVFYFRKSFHQVLLTILRKRGL